MHHAHWIGLVAGLGFIGSAACAGAASGAADAYPNRPIRWILAISPGGSADSLARTLQPGLGEALGQSLVIDNRPGGGSTIGTEITARSVPDGYTLQLITTAHTINASLRQKLPYDSVRDFTPISLIATQSNILVVHPSASATSVRELVAFAKGRPGAISFASGGNGSSPHLTGELFKLLAGIQITHVPYKGTGPAMIDLLGGHVQMIFAGPLAVEQHVRNRRLRALAVADHRRMAVLPDIPTMSEAGFPGVETGTWYGIVAPARTPPGIVQRLHAAITRVLQRPDIKARLQGEGVEILARGPEDFGRVIVADIDKYAAVVRAAGLKVD